MVFSAPSVLRDPFLGYRVIAIIDKSKPKSSHSAQSLSVFTYNPVKKDFEFYRSWRISTGKEESISKKIQDVEVKADGKTPVGFYRVKMLKNDYVSKKFQAEMPFAVFYDPSNGLAIHGTPAENERLLGRRASAGCTRLRKKDAEEFFDLVKEARMGPVVELDPITGLRTLVINSEPGETLTVVPFNPQKYVKHPELLRSLFPSFQ